MDNVLVSCQNWNKSESFELTLDIWIKVNTCYTNGGIGIHAVFQTA